MDTYYIITILDFRHRPIVTWSQPGKGKSSIILNNHTDMRSGLWIIFLPCLKELLHLCLLLAAHAAHLYILLCRRAGQQKADHAERPRVCARFFTGVRHPGAFAGTFGHFLRKYTLQINLVAGAIIVLFGLNFLGILRIPFINKTSGFGHKPKIRVSPPRYYSESSSL